MWCHTLSAIFRGKIVASPNTGTSHDVTFLRYIGRGNVSAKVSGKRFPSESSGENCDVTWRDGCKASAAAAVDLENTAKEQVFFFFLVFRLNNNVAQTSYPTTKIFSENQGGQQRSSCGEVYGILGILRANMQFPPKFNGRKRRCGTIQICSRKTNKNKTLNFVFCFAERVLTAQQRLLNVDGQESKAQ